MFFRRSISICMLVLAGCDDTSSSSSSSSSNASGYDLADSWITNDSNERSNYIYEANSSSGVLVNVESVTEELEAGVYYVLISASGIPNYTTNITQDLHDELTSRPNAATDFVSGSPSISVGDNVSFGEDIGYSSSQDCDYDAGFGYWPPGPVCPDDLDHSGYFPKTTTVASNNCSTSLGVLGYYVNGVSMYNWDDGQSYNDENTWNQLAPKFEVYDIDICDGHAANDDYHHHFYSACLADVLEDEGDGHSPIYGYAADGYALYGPWYKDDELAVSSWRTRDYSAVSSTGCGVDNERSCTLADEYYDASGTVTVVNTGPDTDETVTSSSGNTFTAESGYYYEDYYYDTDLYANGAAYLDQYNGHDTDAEDGTDYGYHYHLTVVEESGSYLPSFPFSVGPKFYGELADNALTQCR